MEVTIAAYNIENMNRMFEANQVKPSERDRARKIAQVILTINPHLLGICEAASDRSEHINFINEFLPGSGYQVAMGASRGAQNLAYWFRPPVHLDSIDEGITAYEPWADDVDADGLDEALRWERKPLEAAFHIDGAGAFRVILVHAKSKGVFSLVDFHQFEAIAQGNRKKLIGQANHLRKRIEQLSKPVGAPPIIVMGDMNDGPGQDAYEMKLGKSFVETVMGNVFAPAGILHNAHHYLSQTPATKSDLWTVEFPDPIVTHAFGYKHRVWIDHILLSPHFLQTNSPLQLIPNSGRIGDKNPTSKAASDHFAVYCRLITGDRPVTQRAQGAA